MRTTLGINSQNINENCNVKDICSMTYVRERGIKRERRKERRKEWGRGEKDVEKGKDRDIYMFIYYRISTGESIRN